MFGVPFSPVELAIMGTGHLGWKVILLFFVFSSFTIDRVMIFTADWPQEGLGRQVPTSPESFV